MMIPHKQLDSSSSTKQTTCRQYVHNNKDGAALQRCLSSTIFFGAVISFHFLSALPFFSFLSALPFFSPFSREHHTEPYANNSHNAQKISRISTRIIQTSPKMFSALLQIWSWYRGAKRPREHNETAETATSTSTEENCRNSSRVETR
jgi:hypothetical protein